jgi:hypothetical protein
LVIKATLGLFIAVWGLVGIRAAQESSTPYVIYPLSGAGVWAVTVGPFMLYHAIVWMRKKQRLSKATRAVPAASGTGRTLPGYSDDHWGCVNYDEGALRVLDEHGVGAEILFSDIHFVEELAPRGVWGFPGIDVLTHAGAWTEMRVTDNAELLGALEQAGVPLVRASNHPFSTRVKYE